MGFYSSLFAIGRSLEKNPDAAKEDSLFKDFDAERERLRNFDLEAPIEANPKPGLRTRRRDGSQS